MCLDEPSLPVSEWASEGLGANACDRALPITDELFVVHGLTLELSGVRLFARPLGRVVRPHSGCPTTMRSGQTRGIAPRTNLEEVGCERQRAATLAREAAYDALP